MNYPALLTAIAAAHEQAQAGAAGAVNRHLILRNWLIGAHLVEFEQQGEDRARYGDRLLERVAADLKKQEIGGCSRPSLQRMRLFYLLYPQLRSEIRSPAVSILGDSLPASDLTISSPPVSESLQPARGAPGALPVPQLQRQIVSLLYERTGLSSDMAAAIPRDRFADSLPFAHAAASPAP